MIRQPSQPTWYDTTTIRRTDRPELDYTAQADVCVVGGGLAGLTTARELARRGWSVVLVEADAIASGASGRNGGFVLDGFALGLADLERRVGLEHAKALHALSREGMDSVRRTIAETRMPGVSIVPGALRVVRHAGGVDTMRISAERASKIYGHELDLWSRSQVQDALLSPVYQGGLHDRSAFHIHPLNYAIGLAADAASHGALLYEKSPALGLDLRSIRRVVRTPRGAVRCNRIVICASALLSPAVQPRIARAVVPVSTFIGVTEPLGDRLADAIRFAGAVSDTRRAGNYFRVVGGDRILWGSGITTRLTPPARLDARLARDMVRTFPQLAGIRMDHAWSGIMAYAAHAMPQIREVERDVWVASAFGGHGLNTTAMAGLVVARALAERDPAWRLFAPFDMRPTWGLAGRMAAQLSYWRLRAKDRLDEAGLG